MIQIYILLLLIFYSGNNQFNIKLRNYYQLNLKQTHESSLLFDRKDWQKSSWCNNISEEEENVDGKENNRRKRFKIVRLLLCIKKK